MKTTFIAMAILMSPLALAQPHRHLHPIRHGKRDSVSPVVKVTDWVSIVKTVETTTTIWLSTEPAAPQPTPVSQQNIPANEHSVPSPLAVKSLNSPASTTETEFPSLVTPSSEQPPIEDLVSAAPAPIPTAESSMSEVELSTATKALPLSPVDFSEHVAAGGQCSPASPCSGDITYYDPGVGFGACGWQNTKDEPVVALPFGFMGTLSNSNALCGKTVTILHDGKLSTAKVVDKCMGCTGFSLDLSNAVFSQLSSLSVGRTSATWWIN